MYCQYSKKRQTLSDLAQEHHKSPRTIRKYFDQHQPCHGARCTPPAPTPIALDATFFGRSYGILVARTQGKNLYWHEIKSETIAEYTKILDSLDFLGVEPSAFVVDGRPGVRNLLLQRYALPVQHCQYHQLQTITQCLSRRPKLPASQQLRSIALTLCKTTQQEFTSKLDQWYEVWKDFLKEKTIHPESKRTSYKHRNLRRAYFSLRKNLPYLFTYQHHSDLNIPNTTNTCDGSFTHWKNKVILHRGLAPKRRQKMIHYLLEQNVYQN